MVLVAERLVYPYDQLQKEERFFIAQCVTVFEVTTGGATKTDPLA